MGRLFAAIASAIVVAGFLAACGGGAHDPGVIVFSGLLQGQRGDGGYYAETPDGTQRRKLPFAGTDFDLMFSADRRFATWWDTKPLAKTPIVVSSADGSRRLTVPLPRAGSATSPSLSRDDRRLAIVYTPDAYHGPWNVWTVTTRGAELKRLTSTGSVIAASWSPDGGRIAFVVQASAADRTVNTGEIYVIRSDGSGLRRLARGRDLSWSPDGRQLAFTDPKYRIEVVSATGGPVQVVARNGVGPAWSPDGKRLAFTRTVPCGGEGCPHTIVVVDADGRHAHRIGPTFGGSSDLLWIRSLS